MVIWLLVLATGTRHITLIYSHYDFCLMYDSPNFFPPISVLGYLQTSEWSLSFWEEACLFLNNNALSSQEDSSLSLFKKSRIIRQDVQNWNNGAATSLSNAKNQAREKKVFTKSWRSAAVRFFLRNVLLHRQKSEELRQSALVKPTETFCPWDLRIT